MTKSERKIRHLYIQSLARIAKSVPLDGPLTKEIFDKLWNENYLHVYSSKYKDMVHNTAARLISDNILRPIGKLHGFLEKE